MIHCELFLLRNLNTTLFITFLEKLFCRTFFILKKKPKPDYAHTQPYAPEIRHVSVFYYILQSPQML